MSAPRPRKRRRSSVSAPRFPLVPLRQSAAAQALALAQKNAALLKEKEIKHFNVSASAFDLHDTNEYLPHLSEVAQGTTELTRIGHKIHVKSIQSRWMIKATEPCVVRVMLIYTNSPWLKAADYGETDFLHGTGGVYNPLNKDNTSRFVVLMDRSYVLQPRFDAEPAYAIDKVFRKTNHVVEWDDTNGDEQNLEQGGFFMLAVSEGLATTECDFYQTSRITFTDS